MKRWPVIRHIRWLWASFLFWTWWESTGHYLGAFPSTWDLEYLEQIKRGDR